MYFILLILRSDVLMFHSWHQSACQQLFWHWEKFIFLNKLISETFCLLGLLNSRSAYQDQQVCAWFSLARLPTEAARKLFLYHFLKETALSFVFWLLEPVQCLGKTFFCTLPFAQSRKILSLFSKLSAILKRQRQRLCNDDVNRASVL